MTCCDLTLFFNNHSLQNYNSLSIEMEILQNKQQLFDDISAMNTLQP